MFGHLQVKSAYSFQKSTILIKDLVREAKKKKIEALALCDTDNMYATMEFYEACLKEGIKPIIGVEATVEINSEKYPFTLLAKDDQGYFDLVHLVSVINLSKTKALPIKQLALGSQHLFVIDASPDGIIERLILKDMETEAEKYMRFFKKIFPDYAIMIQNHGMELQKQLNQRLIAMAEYVQVKVLCSNDVAYLKPQDALAVDLMQASSQGVTLPKDYQVKTSERYLKNESEMAQLFSPEMMAETAAVIESCQAHLPDHPKNLPHYPTPKNMPAGLYLTKLCEMGLVKRFNHQRVPKTYVDRLQYELSVIHKMGFDDYFLIVWDYVTYAKKHSILVGPGRGSACGSLVAYVLGITNIDPLAYDLLFERFLNPERVSMPDIDIDFQDDRRDEVVEYVIQKYGQEHVCQIVTFNTYGPRVAIKDIGKVMGLPLPRLELIAKNVPTGLKNKKTITEMYQTSASFESLVNSDATMRRLIGPMSIIEHLPRNISMHAAGVVLSTRPLDQSVPLVIGPSGQVMSQYSKDYIEKAGLLKMDFLGLRNLTMIAYILKDIKTHEGYDLNLNTIPLDDPAVYQMLQRADTFGVFQLESAGMRSLLQRMKPVRFDDIVIANAIYRPGPMQNIPLYLERRFHKKKTEYIVPELEPILKSTSGVIIYQEQIMQIAQKIAGFSLGKADLLRKAISKKNASLMISMKEDFIAGAQKNGYNEKTAEDIYGLIERFAQYGFNKSHSVAYALIAYQLAYLKVHYPLYFFASILSNDGASITTKIRCIEEAKRYHVPVLLPSINKSQDRFVVEEGGIRYSLTAIKNVGLSGYKVIAIERDENGPFKDLTDFFSRMENKRLNAKMLDSLIAAGAFDEFSQNRAFIKANAETLMEYAHLQNTIGVEAPPVLKDVKENRYRRLEEEKVVLGLYLSRHPLTFMKERLNIQVVNLSDVEEHINQNINVLLVINKIRVIVDKRSREMAFIDGSDDTGSQDFVCFANTYANYSQILKRGTTIVASVKVQMRDRLSLVINKVKEIS